MDGCGSSAAGRVSGVAIRVPPGVQVHPARQERQAAERYHSIQREYGLRDTPVRLADLEARFRARYGDHPPSDEPGDAPPPAHGRPQLGIYRPRPPTHEPDGFPVPEPARF